MPLHSAGAHNAGFTLMEVLAAITIVAIVIAVSVPASVRFYDNMQYRQSIRDVVATLTAARAQAIAGGAAVDVEINPSSNEVTLPGKTFSLPADLTVGLRTAGEVNRQGRGVVRFYPEGGSSGGDIDILQSGDTGTTIRIDWLLGRVSHAQFAPQ